LKKKGICLLLAVMMAMCLLGGCGPNTSEAANTDTVKASSEDSTETRIFTDSAGRQVTVPVHITRIVPSGPLAQMMLFALAPDKLVGLSSEWSDTAQGLIDEKYTGLTVLGQLYGGSSDLNVEQLAKADPQVIIDVGEDKSTIADDMDTIEKQTGIPSVHISAELDNTGESFRMLGDLLGMTEEAEALASYCETTYRSVTDKMEAIGTDNKKKIVYCVGENGLYVIPNGSYHSEVLDLVADNIAVVDNPTSRGTGNEIDMEQLMIWDPDVILFAPGSIYDSVRDDSMWSGLKAVKNGTYYEVPYCVYNWMGFPPSVNRYLGMQWLLKLLYPDQAGYDMYEVTKGYYQMFCHCSLSEEQYTELTANSLGK